MNDAVNNGVKEGSAHLGRLTRLTSLRYCNDRMHSVKNTLTMDGAKSLSSLSHLRELVLSSVFQLFENVTDSQLREFRCASAAVMRECIRSTLRSSLVELQIGTFVGKL